MEGGLDMSFLFDIHIHTEESSKCGETSAAKVVERYKKLGYDGLCITDHMNKPNSAVFGNTYAEKAEAFLRGWRAAKEAAGDDMRIILGMEIRFVPYDNDYLVYGFDEDLIFTRDFTDFASLKEFRQYADENGLIVIQAHPFRKNMIIVDPTLLDGMEVYNGHGGHDSRNDIAYRWAEKYGLRKTSASDFHYDTGMEPGGIYLEEMPSDSKDLARLLRENKYTLKVFTK